MNSRAFVGTLVIALVFASTAAAAIEDDEPTRAYQERTFEGKTIVYWLKVLRDRDEERLSQAFDAIRSLGKDAWIAVPELTRVVGAPFEAIHIGKDSHEMIATKLYDIAVRTEAIETLAWIGEPAAPATSTLVRWGLIRRIIEDANRSPEENDLFIELVAMDGEQRMRTAGAVSAFGHTAYPTIAKLLTSSDTAKRKFAVAILGEAALPMAAELLHSSACEDRGLGLHIFEDMAIVVPKDYLDDLATRFRQDCAMLTKIH